MITRPRFVTSLVVLLSLSAAMPAGAAFHFWHVKEVFSNADGSVQFIELFDSFNNEQFVQSQTLRTNSDGVIKNFTIPSNAPSALTANKHLLFATPGFSGLAGGVTPNYTLPNPGVSGPFFNPNATSITITFLASGDSMTFSGSTLPKNGYQSLTDNGAAGTVPGTPNIVIGTNSPTNFAGTSGSVNLIVPSGDYNRNGRVDAADYPAWRKTLTQAASPAGLGADGNKNGTIDAGDYDFWYARFGNIISGAGGGSAAPEPEDYDAFVENFGESSGSSPEAESLVDKNVPQSGKGIGAAPTVQVVPGGSEANGHLNEDGNWVWLVRVRQTISPAIVDIDNGGPITPGSPLAVELGFKAQGGSDLIQVIANTAVFDTPNPGNPFWGWENYSDTNGDSVIDSTPPTDDEPVGLQSNCSSGLCTENTPGNDPNTVFAALGSVDYGTDTNHKDFLTIITKGPSTAQLSTEITMSGAYAGNGRISELNDNFNPANPSGPPNPISVSYDQYADTFTQTAIAGDANLDDTVDSTDYGIWSSSVGGSNTRWQDGDFNDDDVIDSTDLSFILEAASVPGDFNFDGVVDTGDYVFWRKGLGTIFTPEDYGVWSEHFGEAAGSGAGGAIPEPATAVLLVVGWAVLQTVRRRLL